MLPEEIQNSESLFSLNQQLKAYRTELNDAVSKINTGVFPIKKTIRTIYENIILTINQLKFEVEGVAVPKDQADDFKNGLVTMDEFTNFDLIHYYNGLQQLALFMGGLKIALIDIQEIPPKFISQKSLMNDGILDTLDSDEFLKQGYETPVFELQARYKYYDIQQGDTLATISIKNFNGDPKMAAEISRINKITDNDLIDDNLNGQTILIPDGTVSAINSNMVFEPLFLEYSEQNIERYLFGKSYDLIDRKFQVSGKNDIKQIEGKEVVSRNLKKRWENRKGVNPLMFDFGIISIAANDNVPFLIKLERILQDMENQALQDARVIGCSVLRNSIRIQGTRMDINIETQLIGDRDISDYFEVPV